MSFNITTPTSGRQKEARAKRVTRLPELGWTQQGGYWINPRTGRRYDLAGAIAVEDLRGTFDRERAAEYRKAKANR